MKWPDATLRILTYLRPLLPGVTVARTRQNVTKQVVVDTEWGQLETPISRRCTVLFEVHVKKSNGADDVAAAVDLGSTVLEHLQYAVDTPGIVGFDQPIGPRVVTEPGEPKHEFVEGSLVLVFNA